MDTLGNANGIKSAVGHGDAIDVTIHEDDIGAILVFGLAEHKLAQVN